MPKTANTKRASTATTAAVADFRVGASYLIRTVTHIYTGRVVAIGAHSVQLEQAAWIADTGRFADAVASGPQALNSSEIEPFGVRRPYVHFGAMVDHVEIDWSLPETQK